MPLPVVLLTLLGGCLPDLGSPADPRNCTERRAFYPDDDGNGRGEPTRIFIGCEAPDGWVAQLADSGTPPPPDSAAPTGSTGATADTGRASTGDTAVADTATGGSGTP